MPPTDSTSRKRPHRHASAKSHDSTAKQSVAPSETDATADVENAPWRALFSFTTQANIPLLCVGILASIVGGAVKPASAYLQGKIFESFANAPTGQITTEELCTTNRKYVLYMVGLGAASWLYNSLVFMTWVAFGELQAKSARDRLFYGLLAKDIEWYDMRKNGIGALLPRLQAQIRELQLATSQPFGDIIQLASTSILCVAQSFYFSWDLTLVTISTVPVIMGALVWIGAGMQRAIDNQQAKLTEAQKYSTGAFSAIETVKCFNGQETELRKYMIQVIGGAKYYYKVANMAAIQNGLLQFLACTIFVQGSFMAAS